MNEPPFAKKSIMESKKRWVKRNREQVLEYQSRYRLENPDYWKKYAETNRKEIKERTRLWRLNKLKKPEYKMIEKLKNRKNQQKRKLDVISHYSSQIKCVRCGFKDIRALSIDHIKGNGRKHLREIKQDFYIWLRKNNYPSGFQVLCMNCQFIKRHENKEFSDKMVV